MAFNRDLLLELTERHGPILRITILATGGSVPRDIGTSMTVWPGGSHGTIGGGALEFQAVAQAEAMLANGFHAASLSRVETLPLGPRLGQCCGGQVTLGYEWFDQSTLPARGDAVFARPMGAEASERPRRPTHLPGYRKGWFFEPVTTPGPELWVYGAGHVGRACVQVMAPLDRFDIHWWDFASSRFTGALPPGVTPHITERPDTAINPQRRNACHLIVTHCHETDLAICHSLLGRRTQFIGLIGSATKWRRFQTRLGHLGHSPKALSKITCPVGLRSLGKHPQAIAIGVATQLLSSSFPATTQPNREPVA